MNAFPGTLDNASHSATSLRPAPKCAVLALGLSGSSRACAVLLEAPLGLPLERPSMLEISPPLAHDCGRSADDLADVPRIGSKHAL